MPLTTTKTPAMRLPPLRSMRVRRANQQESPCISVLASVLGCWASAGFNIAKCAEVEQALRGCMDGSKAKANQKIMINRHLSRLYPKIMGPRKRE